MIGLVHAAVGVTSYARFACDPRCFQGIGLAVLLIGAGTLNSAFEHASHALVLLAGLANLGALAEALAFGVVSGWQEGEGPLRVGDLRANALYTVVARALR